VAALKTASSPAFWSEDDAVLVALETDGANCPPDKPGKGLVVLKIRADPAPSIETAWCGNVASVHGSPIVTTTDGRSNPIIFALGAQGDHRLYAFRGDTGELLVSPRDRVPGTKDFGTLIAADGRLYVTGGGKIYAFTF
jgi:outer membrane protein assembly factor BamB